MQKFKTWPWEPKPFSDTSIRAKRMHLFKYLYATHINPNYIIVIIEQPKKSLCSCVCVCVCVCACASQVRERKKSPFEQKCFSAFALAFVRQLFVRYEQIIPPSLPPLIMFVRQSLRNYFQTPICSGDHWIQFERTSWFRIQLAHTHDWRARTSSFACEWSSCSYHPLF